MKGQNAYDKLIEMCRAKGGPFNNQRPRPQAQRPRGIEYFDSFNTFETLAKLFGLVLFGERARKP